MAEVDGESARIQKLIADIDSLCTDERWDAVVELRDTCRLAVARGHQWWPAAAWAEFRIALDGPGRLAASVLHSSLSRYTLGPFAEVAASSHSWDDLVDFLEPSPTAAMFAHECIALGDDLRTDDLYQRLPAIFDLPAALQPWEPDYGPVVYHLDRVEHLAPILPGMGAATSTSLPVAQSDTQSGGSAVETLEDQASCDALAAVLVPWSESLQWSVLSEATDGDARTAYSVWVNRASGRADGVPILAVTTDVALRYLAWLGASGGPIGRRRGLAASRSSLWWVLLQLTGFADDLDGEPVAAADAQFLEQFTAAIASLRWFTWSSSPELKLLPDPSERAVGTQRGWTVHLAVEAPAEGISWVLAADELPST